MLSPSLKFNLSLACLWLTVIFLSVITFITLIGTLVRSDCEAIPSRNITAVTDVDDCSSMERISNVLLRNASYLQSVHTIVFQVFVAASLVVFQPALRSLVWSSLETKNASRALSLGLLNSRIQLSTSPGLIPGVTDVWNSRRLTRNTVFVIFLGILSLIIPILISPIYRMQNGSLQGGNLNMAIGGGIGLPTAVVWDPLARSAGGITAGRALLNSAAVTNKTLSTFSYSPTVNPFFDISQVPKIARATIQTGVAYQSVDCGASAPARFVPQNTPGQLVNITATNTAASFWDNVLRQGTVSAGAMVIGEITNDPHVTVFYLGGTNSTGPGWVNATTSVVFLAANGTIEGAQQSIVAPAGSNGRVNNVDVLACTSTVSLGLSNCEVVDGRVTLCTPIPEGQLSTSTSGTTSRDLDGYIMSPISTATTLSASPATAYFSYLNFIPGYDKITPANIAGGLPPLSYLTDGTVQAQYNIPQSYVQGTLFSEAGAALVQGMVMATESSYYANQPADLIVVFATSAAPLQIILISIAVACAIATTVGALRTKAREAAELDVARILAMSRNPQLDYTFAPFTDRTIEVPNSIQELRVHYGYVAGTDRLGLSLYGPDYGAKGPGLAQVNRQESDVNQPLVW
jgi:hypothetical protein